MKKIIAITLFFTMIVGGLKSQNSYKPILNADSVQWDFCDDPVDMLSFVYIFRAIEDVNVDGLNYKRLYVSNPVHYLYDSLLYYYTKRFIGYVREDTTCGRLWFLSNYFDREILIMDMSLSVGDTFLFDFGNFYNWNFFSDRDYVTEVDTNNGRIVLTFSDGTNFIEGIGHAYMFYPEPRTNSYPYTDRYLLNFYKNDSLLYGDGGGIPSYEGYKIECPSKTKITTYPNPAKNQITFSFQGQTFEKLQVINSTGIIVKNIQLPKQEAFTLSVKELPSGVYAYRLSGKNGTSIGKFIVR